jgi:hypothetical protein
MPFEGDFNTYNCKHSFLVYDASAKLPSGILRGNVNQLGDFDQCLDVTSQYEPRIDGKYCLASVDVESTELNNNDIESLQQAVQLAQAYGFIKSSYRDVSFIQNTLIQLQGTAKGENLLSLVYKSRSD